MNRRKSTNRALLLAASLLACGPLPPAAATEADQSDATFDCVVEPSEVVDVGSAVPGVIERITVDRSDLVHKGMVIAKLESGAERAAMELARVRARLTTGIELQRANAGYNLRKESRNKELFQKALLSRNDMDLTRTETRIAQLQVRQEQDNQLIAGLELQRAREVLERRTIHSPIDGVVLERFKAAGEYVKDTPLARIARLDPLYVEVILPVDQLGRIHKGMQAEVAIEAPGQPKRRATVSRVDRVADAASGTFGVRLQLPNPGYRIPSGLRCRLAFLPTTEPIPAQPVTRGPATDTSAAQPRPAEARQPVMAPALQAVGPEEGTTDDAPAAANPGGRVCYTLGPLANAPLAERLKQQLADATRGIRIRSHQAPGPTRYLVLAKPQDDTTTQALLSRIEATGNNDVALLGRGQHRGRISLGVYNSASSAHRRQAALADRQIPTEIVTLNAGAGSYWLELSLDAGEDGETRLRDAIAAVPPGAGLRPSDCGQQLAVR